MKSFVGFCWIFPPFARKIEKRPSHTLFFHREYIYRVIESSRGVLLCRQFRAVSLSFLYSQGSMGIMGGLLELVLENYYLVVTRYAVDHVYRVFTAAQRLVLLCCRFFFFFFSFFFRLLLFGHGILVLFEV